MDFLVFETPEHIKNCLLYTSMYKVGHMLPYQLRETALGGVAVTETGLKSAEALHAKKS